jgi:hypothetical protein
MPKKVTPQQRDAVLRLLAPGGWPGKCVLPFALPWSARNQG